MSEHDDLVRALLVERYRRWPPPDDADADAQQLAAALFREKRRTGGTPKRTAKPRRLTDTDRRRAT